jgi:hypothetical protein
VHRSHRLRNGARPSILAPMTTTTARRPTKRAAPGAKQLESLLALFGGDVRVKHVMEDLASVDAAGVPRQALAKMKRRSIDALGVLRDGVVVGCYVAGDATWRKLEPEDLITESTPIRHVLPILCRKERLFVLEHDAVRAIVTRSDLHKAPVRLFFYGLATLLESELTGALRRRHVDDRWQAALGPDRLAAAQALWRERRARREEIDLLDCLQLCDKRDLVLADEALRARLGFGAQRRAKAFFKSAEQLRNRLAHGQPVVDEGGWPEVLSLVAEIERCVRACIDAV